MRNHRRGFTLFETVVTVAVVSLLAALVIPSISSMYGDTPQTAAADKVKSRWAEAKARAASENRPYRFAIMEGTARFRVAPDSPEFWDGTSAPDGTSLVIDDKLPKDIRFCTPENSPNVGQPQAEGSGSWGSPIVFLPDGTTREDAVIAFSEPNARPVILQLRATTGAVTMSR